MEGGHKEMVLTTWNIFSPPPWYPSFTSGNLLFKNKKIKQLFVLDSFFDNNNDFHCHPCIVFMVEEEVDEEMGDNH